MAVRSLPGGGEKPTSSAVSSMPERQELDRAWQRASQIAVIGLFVIALLWCAYVAQHVIVPVLLAWTIATIVLPVVKWMEGQGLPRAVAALPIARPALLASSFATPRDPTTPLPFRPPPAAACRAT